VWEGLGHLKTSEVGEVLERSVVRIERSLRRRGLLRTFYEDDEGGTEADPRRPLRRLRRLGQAPPAGPQWVRRLAPLEPQALAYDKQLCASPGGFTLHAATRAGRTGPRGPRGSAAYVLRAPIAQERLEQRPDGFVRHHAQEGVRWRHGVGRHGRCVIAVPAGGQCAGTALPYDPIRCRARGRFLGPAERRQPSGSRVISVSWRGFEPPVQALTPYNRLATTYDVTRDRSLVPESSPTSRDVGVPSRCPP